MDALLICPGKRPATAALARETPLVTVPLMGRNLLEYWLCHLAAAAVKEVWILADDRPDEVEAAVDEGRRWGLRARVIPEQSELSPAQALLKHGPTMAATPPNSRVAVLDHFPGLSHHPLFSTYRSWFEAVQAWVPYAQTPDRVCVREIQPGIWADLSARISPGAELEGPSWVGRNAVIESGATIGPGAVIEEGAFVERDAGVTHSYIGPDTFVGRYTEVLGSVAWGTTVVDLQSGTVMEVQDTFMLCSLRKRRNRRRSERGWLSGLAKAWVAKPALDLKGQ